MALAVFGCVVLLARGFGCARWLLAGLVLDVILNDCDRVCGREYLFRLMLVLLL